MEKFRLKMDIIGTPNQIIMKLMEYTEVIQITRDGDHSNAIFDGAEWGEDENGKFEVTIWNV